ncbi:MAG TPA: TauD/TfdA family dioxygenase [Pyrinomonadaceae bacterium]
MDDPRSGKPGSPAAFRRRLVSVSPESMVNAKPLFPGRRLPLLVTPSVKGMNLTGWAAGNAGYIGERLSAHGAILFRDFGVKTADEFQRFISAVSGEALEYSERSSPRSRVASTNIYTSTDYPAGQSIFVHNENSYKRNFNLKIFFFCETAPSHGGETPIADCRNVYGRIPAEVRDRFADKGWMCVRNYGDGFGLDWRTAFQTSDPKAVEEHCRHNGIEFEWGADGHLRTRAVLPAVITHPHTGETVWFNHATFYHVSTLETPLREGLLAGFDDEADLPTNTYYGDGSRIEPETLDELREAYRRETVSFPWQAGDVLMLDNILAAHGRAPYAGARRILVGMTELVNR